MKKFLSRIFSALLIVATVASPSFAQTAKKVVSAQSAKQTVVAAKAPTKKSRTMPLPERRSASKSHFAVDKKAISAPVKASAKAPAKEISVYDFSIVIFTAILGFVFLDQIPDVLSVVGYVIIIGTAVIKWYMTIIKKKEV